MRVIGDIHGAITPYLDRISGTEKSVQIGDFGFGFLSNHEEDYLRENMPEGNHRFIRGNHDDPQRCREQDCLPLIEDGIIEDDIMYIGGAWSIDAYRRLPGVTWWYDEECSEHDLFNFVKYAEQVRPRVIISHDGPKHVVKGMFLGPRDIQHPNRTSTYLQYLLDVHKPELWIFGHWHQTKEYKMGGVTFQCLGINDYIDL